MEARKHLPRTVLARIYYRAPLKTSVFRGLLTLWRKPPAGSTPNVNDLAKEVEPPELAEEWEEHIYELYDMIKPEEAYHGGKLLLQMVWHIV